MSAIKLSTPSSGSISLSPADTASNLTITVPAVTGTMAIQGPAFSASQSTLQALTSTTFTKLDFQTEEFDTNSNFASNRFTPTVAGYYQINGSVGVSASTGIFLSYIYKNGSTYKSGSFLPCNASGAVAGVSSIVYLNGSTDYVELYGYQSSGTSANTIASGTFTYFNGVLVRAE